MNCHSINVDSYEKKLTDRNYLWSPCFLEKKKYRHPSQTKADKVYHDYFLTVKR